MSAPEHARTPDSENLLAPEGPSTQAVHRPRRCRCLFRRLMCDRRQRRSFALIFVSVFNQ